MSSAASPLPWGGPPGPPSTDHVADRGWTVRSRTGRSAKSLGSVLLELDDGDGLPDAGAALPEELVQPEDGGHLRRGVASRRSAAPWAPAQACGVRGVGDGSAVLRAAAPGCRRRADAGGSGARRSVRRRRRSGDWAGVTLPQHGVLLEQAVEADHAGHHAGERGRDLRRRRVHDGPGRSPGACTDLERRAQRGRDHRRRAADRAAACCPGRACPR